MVVAAVALMAVSNAVPYGTALAAGPGEGRAVHPPVDSSLGNAGTSSPTTAWNPASGRSSPGAPHYSLRSASLATSGCNASYAGEAWLAFDSFVGAYWIANAPSCLEEVTVSSTFGASVVATYTVGSAPFAVAVDSATHEVYVTNTGSDNVTVLNDTTGASVASIGVGSAPSGIAYDPLTGLLFVANNGSNNVSVINGSRHVVVASLPVGSNPIGVAADPATQRVFVADSGSDNVTVLSTASLKEVGSIGAGSEPYGAVVDNRSDQVYVSNRGSSNLSVVNASSLTVTASVAVVPAIAFRMDVQGLSYDPLRNFIWVAAGGFFAVVVNASKNAVEWYLGIDPSGVAVDPATGNACLTNTANRTLLCLSNYTFSQNSAWSTAEFDFNETGLPAGTAWSVSVDQATAAAPTPTLRVGVLSAFASSTTYNYSIASVDGFAPSPSLGTITINSTTTVVPVNVTFGPGPATYSLVFNQTGLPAGTTWGVTVGGVSGRTASSSLTFALTNGTYTYSVASVPGYTAASSSGTVVIDGSGLEVALTFSPSPPPPPATTYFLTFLESGLPTGTSWSVLVDGASHATATGGISLVLPVGTYPYTVGPPPGYRASPANGTVYLGSNLSVAITFLSAFTLTFAETGLPSGDNWTVAVAAIGGKSTSGGGVRNSSASSIAFPVAGGVFSYTVASEDPAYAPTPSSGAVTVTSDTVVPITFGRLFPFVADYAVTFQENGLPSGAAWTVVVNGTAAASNSTTIAFLLTNGTYPFQVLPALGATPAPISGTFIVSGGPLNLTIQFTSAVCTGCPPPPFPPTHTGGSGSRFGVLLLGLAGSVLVGVAIGLVFGYILADRRRGARNGGT